MDVNKNALFGGVMPVLNKSMDLRSRKHSVSSSNIANVDTPGYRAFNLEVENALQRMTDRRGSLELNKEHDFHLSKLSWNNPRGTLARTRKAHLRSPETADEYTGLISADKTEFKSNSNNVDLDLEMGRLSSNHLLFNANALMMSRKFSELRNVIKGDK